VIRGEGRKHHRHDSSGLRGARREVAERQLDLVFWLGLWALGSGLWALGSGLRCANANRFNTPIELAAGLGAVVVLFQAQQY
jgi:hypothetical protein